MSQPNAVSGQVAVLTIGNITFGVTKVEAHTSWINADTTVTQNSSEQYTPIVVGGMLDVTVPLGPALTSWIDDVFDDAEYPDNPTQPPNAVHCKLDSNPDGGETFEGDFLLEDYRVVYDAKDAARVIFTIRLTGDLV